MSADARVWRSRSSVGISGPIAAGKTTAARFLESIGFAYGRYSEVLAALLRQKGMEVNRTTLQEFGEKVHRKPGQRWLSRQLIASLPKDRRLVIDGMRFPEDHAAMVESFGPAFLHIHVEASEAIRRARSIVEGNSAEEFEASIRHPVEAKILLLAALAHVRIVNESSLADFEFELRRSVEVVAAELSVRDPQQSASSQVSPACDRKDERERAQKGVGRRATYRHSRRSIRLRRKGQGRALLCRAKESRGRGSGGRLELGSYRRGRAWERPRV